MQLGHYLGLLLASERELAAGLRRVRDAQPGEVDVFYLAGLLADECERHVQRLEPFAHRYGQEAGDEPARLYHDLLLGEPRSGPLALLRDLHDLYLLATSCDITWTMVGQAAKGARDRDLLATVEACEGETARQLQWLRTRMKTSAVQALVVA